MSLKSSQVLDRDNLNRSFLSKSATGTQIFQGSLRMLGGLDVGGQTIKTTGTIYAGIFSGSFSGNGASITSINASNISSGTISDARLGSTVMQTDVAQTITANKTMNSVLYFANGTTYYIDNQGDAKVNTLTVASNASVTGALSITGDITFSGKFEKRYADTISNGSSQSGVFARIGIASSSAAGFKMHDGGQTSALYIENGYDSNGTESGGISIDNDGVTAFGAGDKGYVFRVIDEDTRSTIFQVEQDSSDARAGATHVYKDLLVEQQFEVREEIKHSAYNEFPDPVLASLGIGRWGGVRGAWTFDSAQKPTGTNANGSIKVVPTTTDAYAYWGEYFDVTPDEWITFSCYVFSTVSGRASQLYIQWSDSAKATLASGGHVANDISNTATSWTRYSLTAKAPSGARYFRVRIDNDGGGPTYAVSSVTDADATANTGSVPTISAGSWASSDTITFTVATGPTLGTISSNNGITYSKTQDATTTTLWHISGSDGTTFDIDITGAASGDNWKFTVTKTEYIMFFSAFQIERGRAMTGFKPGSSNLELSDDGTYSRLSRSGEQILAYWNDNTKLKLGGKSGNITTFTDGPFGVKMEPADGTTVDINGQSGSSGYQNFRVRYQVGGTQGGLANTELSGLAHRTYGSTTNWAALYAKAGSAHWAGLFDGRVSISGNLGIGTDNPGYPIEAVGNNIVAWFRNSGTAGADTGIEIRGARNGYPNHLTAYADFANFDDNNGTSGTAYVASRIGGGMDTDQTTKGMFGIEVNNGGGLSRALTINHLGNTGIGTSAPVARLHLNGASNLPASSAISYASQLVVSSVDGNMDLMSYDDNTDVSHSIGFGRYKNDSTGAIIDKAGIVIRANTSTAAGANTINRIAFTFGASKDPWSNAEVFSVNRNGNMTVGGNITSGNITSSGVIKSTNTTGFEYTGASSNNTDGTGNAAIKANDYSQWIWNTATTWGLFWAGNSGAAYSAGGTIARASTNPDEFVFVGGGVVLLSIGGAAGNTYIKGNLGLGTASPAEKLDVEGNARVNGAVKVKDRFSFEYNSSQDALEIKVI